MSISLIQRFDAIVANALTSKLYNNLNLYSEVAAGVQAHDKTGPLVTKSALLPRSTDALSSDRMRSLLPSLPQPSANDATPPVLGNIRSNQYSDKNTFAPIATASPIGGTGGFDVFALAHWARNIGQEFGALGRPGQTAGERAQNVGKGISFLATQFLLATFNPGDLQLGGPLNQLYNPLHLPLSALPLLRGATTIGSPNAAAALSVTGEVYSRAFRASPDRMLLRREGAYVKAIDATSLSKLDIPGPQFLGDVAAQGDSLFQAAPIAIRGQVEQEGPSDFIAKVLPVHKNIYTPGNTYSDGPALDLTALEKKLEGAAAFGVPFNLNAGKLKLDELFAETPGSFLGGVRYSWLAKARLTAGSYGVNKTSFPTDVSVKFPNENDRDGTVPENRFISDADNYMPFFFQDLRDATPSLLYFRAFLHDGMQENFSPNWNAESFYGRVDEVPTYQNTSRTVSLAFDIVAWSPEDLNPMYRKLHKLQSMVYPSYDNDGYIQAGPLIRMRVGDLICAQSVAALKKGLPGYINTLSFAYDDGIWNINTDFKVPRKISVTLGFTVIHEGNPGVYPFQTFSQPDLATAPVLTTAAGPLFGTLSAPNAQGTSTVSPATVRGVIGSVSVLPFGASAPNE